MLTVDGQLAPCRGVFQRFDDFADLAAAGSFQQAWNSASYRTARGLFRARDDSLAARRLPCHDCPTAIFHERWRTHRAAGGRLASFDPGMPLNVNGA